MKVGLFTEQRKETHSK